MKRNKIVLILIITFLLVNISSNFYIVEAESTSYQVKKIDDKGSLKQIGKDYDKFIDAEEFMQERSENNVVVTSSKNKSPLKIVSMKEGYLQSYPYRKGLAYKHRSPGVTLNIYSKKDGKSTKTYVSAHYKMYYHKTEVFNNELVAKVTINGATGYVDINKTDLIPMKFINDEIDIKLGGNEDYYDTPENVDTIKIKHDFYEIDNNEVIINYSRTHSSVNQINRLRYASAPSWLKNKTKYYSTDGIKFFKEPTLKTPIYDGNSIGEFYAYYQWLPIRSLSHINSDQLNDYLIRMGKTNSVIFDNEQAFIENGNKYGMNALLLFAQAALESDYGTSSYAKTRYNLFGWNAYDSNPDLATTYDGVFTSVKKQMSYKQLNNYFFNKDWRNEGMSFGNKGSGVTVRYASDPYYGNKIANIAYNIDKQSGHIDNHVYDMIKINNSKAPHGLNVRQKASSSSNIWYTTKGGNENRIRTNLEDKNGFIKTNLSMPIDGNSAVEKSGLQIDLTKEFGYLAKSHINKIKKNGTAKSSVPQTRVITYDEDTNASFFEIKEDLRLRRSWTTDSSVLLVIPKGTVLSGFKTNNNWVKVNYKNKIGYVHNDYLKDSSDNNPSTPEDSDEDKPKLKGDLNNDDEINISDMMVIQRHILGIKKLSGHQLDYADLNNDGEINISDMMVIQRHILGIKKIS